MKWLGSSLWSSDMQRTHLKRTLIPVSQEGATYKNTKEVIIIVVRVAVAAVAVLIAIKAVARVAKVVIGVAVTAVIAKEQP